ncbi:MAG: hypothetical protein ACRC6E_14000 [Fusobacteriaceae bacterium]
MEKIRIRKGIKHEGTVFTNVNLQKDIFDELENLTKRLNVPKKNIVATALERFKDLPQENVELRIQQEYEPTLSYTVNVPPKYFEYLNKLAKEYNTAKKTIVVTALERLFKDVETYGIDE